jgi:tRNA(Ser,Leu) C12 N-acetylase TAN1
MEQISSAESFCFRITKRGTHHLEQATPKIEAEIGGAIWTAIEQKYGKKPTVNLDDPDVTILAEVFGADTLIGVLKKEWQQASSDQTVAEQETHVSG